MSSKVYLETTIVSYLTAWPSRDIVRAAQQEVTREWWKTRESFDLYASELVADEAAAGDPDAAARRLQALRGVQLVAMTPEAKPSGGS